MKTLKELLEMAEKGTGFVIFLGIRRLKKTTDPKEVQTIDFEYQRVMIPTVDLPECLRQFKQFAENDIKEESEKIQDNLNKTLEEGDKHDGGT